MLVFVTEIRHDGIVLARPDSDVGCYWLPATDWLGTSLLWENVRAATQPGMPIGVSLVPGRHIPGGLQVVSARGSAARELDLAWKGEMHALRIDSMSKTLIRGHIGEIEVVMKREEYTAFLNTYPRNELIQDHGALALGDWICGIFVSEDGPEGLVQLGFADALSRIANECNETVGDLIGRGAPERVESVVETPGRPVRLFHASPEALNPVLFVENDNLCRQMWTTLLTDAGVEVDAFGAYEDAVKAIEAPARKYKLAIVDVHLAGAHDHLGLDLARALACRPECRVILTSAEDGSGRKRDAWGDLRVYGYIEKPALLDDWAAAIDAAVAAPWATPLRELLSEPSEQVSDVRRRVPDCPIAASASVASALDAFCKDAPGVVAHVFRLHPRSWRGRSLGHAGGRLDWEPYRGKLGKSVIRDAAGADRGVVYNNAEDEWPHKWTKAMLDYHSFWGRRLPVPGSQYRYVLVAFHHASEFFSSENDLKAQHCAEKVTGILTREHLLRREAYHAEQSSAGLGFACLAHEIYTTLTGVDMAITKMSTLLPAARAGHNDAETELHEVVTQLSQRVPDLVTNARILRGPAGGNKPVSLVFCLEKAVAGIEDAKWAMLDRPEKVKVVMERPDAYRTWMLTANAGALVTVFFNVLLNAIQQIEMFSEIRGKGVVRVSAHHYSDERGMPWAHVFVKDSGPGIHPDDWESIFDAGHTTKENGTGLGLHICRELLNRVRVGRRSALIRIARSVLWAGTTVAIELPLSSTSGE